MEQRKNSVQSLLIWLQRSVEFKVPLNLSQPTLPVKLSPLGEVSLDFCLSPCFGSAVLSAELGIGTTDEGETVANTSPLSDAVEDLLSCGWLDKLRSASRLTTLLFLLG